MPYSWMWKRLAEAILPDGVPLEVLRRLARVNELIEKAGGELNSRQVVALVIEQYEREQGEPWTGQTIVR